jgi:hypothetical protein
MTNPSGCPNPFFQLEVKLHLAKVWFSSAEGWVTTVHVDPMELGGEGHAASKRERTGAALNELRALGVSIGIHDLHGRVDIVADHQEHGRRLIEVEADSSRQREQALYSSLGQIVLSMRAWGSGMRHGIAVPDRREWRKQLAKIPQQVRQRLSLDLYMVRPGGVTLLSPDDEMVEWDRG